MMRNHHFYRTGTMGDREAMRGLYDEYKRVLECQAFREEDLDYSRLDYHLPFLERLDAIEGSSVALYDLRKRGYAFVTGSFKFLVGYSREEAVSEGPDYFYRFIHPEDLPFVLDTVTRSLRFHYALPPERRKDYKLGFDFRIRRAGKADGPYLRLVQQILALESDARGKLWLVLIVNDALEGEAEDRAASREMVDLRDGSRHLFAEAGDGGRVRPDLSRRELEILGLVALGMASREIADSLSISVATVNNHRQHILEKVGARNSSEAVAYAAKLGLLPP
jgi:DNA-binding CsgD family transcriptional regulator